MRKLFEPYHIKNLVLKVLASTSWRHILTLFSGSFLAQAFAVALMPVIARLYLPEEFGITGVFMASIAVLVVVINGGYEWAIMLPQHTVEAHRLLLLSLLITLLGSFFVLGMGWLCGAALLQLIKTPQLLGWHLLIPLSLALEGICQALRVSLNRNQQYKGLSLSKVARSIVQATLSLFLGIYGMGFEGLIYGFIFGQLACSLVLIYGYIRWFFQQNFDFFQQGLAATARQYKDFPRFSVLSSWLNTASKHLPFFILPVLFSQEINGQFSQADRILTLPVVLLSMSIGQVFFEQASKAKQESRQALATITKKTFRQLVFLAIPFLLISMLFAPFLFSFVLGEEWRLAGEYARWLSPWMAMAFVTSPLAFLIDIQRKLKAYLLLNLALFIVRLMVLLMGGYFLTDIHTMIIYGFCSMLIVGGQLIYLLRIGAYWKWDDEKLVQM